MKRQKARIVLKFLEVANHFSLKMHGSILSSRSLSKYFYLYKGFSWKIFWFSPLCQITGRPVMQKSAISFEKPRFSITSFLNNYLIDFLQQCLRRKLPKSSKPFSWKTVGFCPCIRILIVRKIRESALKFDSCGHSNWRFSVTTCSISFIEISIENITLVAQDSVEN